ncbi:hypothetical protein B0H13DRAFT_2537104 [Mycena leptocephala]|nr:hypothetical protein B0H13DRAFT_2537104 [Mycena leptocephala]
MYATHVFPSRSLGPLRSPPALFHGHEDTTAMLVSSVELPALLWQTGGFQFVIPCFDMGVLSHFTSGAYFSSTLIADLEKPTRLRPGYVAAAFKFCGSSTQAAFLSARSPSHSPSSCTPAPVLYPVRRSRWSSSSLFSAIPPPSLAYPPQCTYPLFPLLPLRLPSFSLGILTLHAVILPQSFLVRVLGRLQTSFCVRDNGLDRRPLCSCLALLLFSPTDRPVPASLQLRPRHLSRPPASVAVQVKPACHHHVARAPPHDCHAPRPPRRRTTRASCYDADGSAPNVLRDCGDVQVAAPTCYSVPHLGL